MRSITLFPFLRSDPDRIVAGEWHTGTASEPLPDMMETWDPVSPIRAARAIQLDPAGIREDCGLNRSHPIILCASWYSSGTSLRGRGSRIELREDSSSVERVLSVDIPGTQLAGDVRIRTVIALGRKETGRSESLAAILTGSMLWHDDKRVLLEGIGSRFPTRVVDFAEQMLPADAGWFLSWDAQLPDAPLLGTVELLINSRHPRVCDAVSRKGKLDAAQQAILSAIYFDVGRMLICGMLRSEAFFEGIEGGFPPATIGQHVASLIRLRFPGESVNALRAQLVDYPEKLESRLQQTFRLFG